VVSMSSKSFHSRVRLWRRRMATAEVDPPGSEMELDSTPVKMESKEAKDALEVSEWAATHGCQRTLRNDNIFNPPHN
jgi:hypothetical protein